MNSPQQRSASAGGSGKIPSTVARLTKQLIKNAAEVNLNQLEHIEAIETRLRTGADTLRANSNYVSNEYFLPVMGFFPAITKKDLYHVSLLSPSDSLVRQLVNLASPIDKQIETLQRATSQLQADCDPLLPRLMSGEVVV